MSKYRVSADIGGTFTDIIVEPADGPTFMNKVETTPGNPAEGILNGIREVVPNLSEVDFFVHGTTVGLNAFLERKGERVLLLMTEGISDTFTIARGGRERIYDLHYKKSKPLVPRHDVHEIGERLAWNGDVINPVRRADFDPIIEKIKAENINAVAVCFLHAYRFPQHEIEASEILKKALPGLSVSLSHEMSSEWREFERASTTVVNAYIAPVVERYLRHLQDALHKDGMAESVHIMHSNGGIMTADRARERPVHTLMSGPVGGTIACTSLAKSTGRSHLLCVDMGGTSFDLSIVIDGKATIALEANLEGVPLLMPIVDIATIGTGGGSIAWLENAAPRVGPHSAGAVPGPVCYGRGGKDITTTDANLYLKRLGAESLLKGKMSLDSDGCEAAMNKLAKRAGLEPLALAEGILRISNAAMASAMRTITISQGVDPREFTLVAFGGAGPMAAAFLAEELGMAEVLIPKFPGALSAWGMLQTDLRQDFTTNYYCDVNLADIDEIGKLFTSMEKEGRDGIMGQGASDDDISFERVADMRYVGQEYTINVNIPDVVDIDQLSDEFHTAYQMRYGHSNPSAPIEFVNLRVAAIGKLNKYVVQEVENTEDTDPIIGCRDAVFGSKKYKTNIYSREKIRAGFRVDGPLIIEEKSATSVVPPGWTAELDASGNIILSKGW